MSSGQVLILPFEPAASVSLLINVHVQTTPIKISVLIAETIKQQEIISGCKIMADTPAAFQPGYPTPVHRFMLMQAVVYLIT